MDETLAKQGSKVGSNKLKIGDLARHLGLSKGTVSRALSGYPDISEKTKERVIRAANELGYKPSSYARALSTGLARSAALVLSVSGDSVQKAYLPDILDGLSTRLGADGWTLTVATASPEEDDLAVQERLIAERKVDGFIITRTRRHDPRITALLEAEVPFVMYGRQEDMSGKPSFDYLGETAMEQAVIRLARLGHRRIGYIGARDGFYMQERRTEGYVAGLADAGLPLDMDMVRAGGMTEAEGAALAADLLAQTEPPTAIVCAMDVAALGAYRAVEALGLRVGHEVSLMAYDGIAEGAYARPGLTTYAVDGRAAGQALADLLLRRIAGEAPDRLQETGEARLIARGSDRAPALTSAELAVRIAGR
ncbi:LacI family DNA-binding transcriptional regulator [Algicella marina]|uniref:LacI family DNA-binding transcriptional regulator n=1 Tax=Algicella marina TaxID=2683284 RepID=A0A6P1T4L2_9RHOB|nr:LacI family DNA-binding transcriptional regulator [Algicella marina]QHQ36947.1 LacI family DNA-binding transcriptional regulator [Algicella marina]